MAPEHITKWCAASEDWHVPKAENDLRTGGQFTTRMEAKDGSFGFDFGGIYDNVKTNETISYTMSDGRKVNMSTSPLSGNSTEVVETFDAENQKIPWRCNNTDGRPFSIISRNTLNQILNY